MWNGQSLLITNVRGECDNTLSVGREFGFRQRPRVVPIRPRLHIVLVVEEKRLHHGDLSRREA